MNSPLDQLLSKLISQTNQFKTLSSEIETTDINASLQLVMRKIDELNIEILETLNFLAKERADTLRPYEGLFADTCQALDFTLVKLSETISSSDVDRTPSIDLASKIERIRAKVLALSPMHSQPPQASSIPFTKQIGARKYLFIVHYKPSATESQALLTPVQQQIKSTLLGNLQTVFGNTLFDSTHADELLHNLLASNVNLVDESVLYLNSVRGISECLGVISTQIDKSDPRDLAQRRRLLTELF